MSYAGRCNCGKFEFEAPAHQGVAACFCKCCVRAGGSLCSMNAVIPVDGLKFTKGSKDQLSVYIDNETTSGNPMERSFCGTCGSAIQSIPKGSPLAFFKFNSLNDPEAYAAQKPPNMTLFVKDAPAWAKVGGKADDGTKGLQWPTAGETNYFTSGPS